MNPLDRSRHSNPLFTTSTRQAFALRVRQVRWERFGTDGAKEVARQLGIPVRAWINYEAGVWIPAEIILGFIELTGVRPEWLLYGKGNPYVAFPSLRKTSEN